MRRLLPILFIISLIACSQAELTTHEPELVVEGYIDDGGYPMVMLTTSLPVNTDGFSFDSLSTHLLREMRKPRQYVKPGEYYAWGLETSWLGDMQCVYHGGSLPGVSSNIAFSPEGEIGVVVLCNTMDVPVYAVSDAIMRLFLGFPMLPERPQHETYNWPAEFRADIDGDYISGEGDSFRLEDDGHDGIRMLLNGKEIDMKPVFRDQGLVRKKYADVYLQFIKDEDGHVYAARYGSRVFPKS